MYSPDIKVHVDLKVSNLFYSSRSIVLLKLEMLLCCHIPLPVDRVIVKGRHSPTDLYELLAARSMSNPDMADLEERALTFNYCMKLFLDKKVYIIHGYMCLCFNIFKMN